MSNLVLKETQEGGDAKVSIIEMSSRTVSETQEVCGATITKAMLVQISDEEQNEVLRIEGGQLFLHGKLVYENQELKEIEDRGKLACKNQE